MTTETLPRRIEAEDLLPGDVFEYEHDDYGWNAAEQRRVWLPPRLRQDTVRKVATQDRVINDRVTNPDCLRGDFMDPEEIGPGLFASPWVDGGERGLGKVWAEPGQRFENAIFLLTHIGSNNHGYVALRPKTVVVLVKRAS